MISSPVVGPSWSWSVSFALAGLLTLAETLEAKRAPLCPGGRYLVEGAAGAVDAVAIEGDGTIALGACGATRGTLRRERRFTTVLARWARCGTLAKLRLKARIGAPACDELTGTLRAKGQASQSLRARRSACGDGIVDGPAGEECEAQTADGDRACPGACNPTGSSAACRCGGSPAPPTTSVPPSTSSSSTTTSTAAASSTTTSSANPTTTFIITTSTTTSSSTTSTSSSTSTTSTGVPTTTFTTTTSTSVPSCVDVDGDGWRTCDGDCCDDDLDCLTPGLVNPGAFEVGGNGLDDDCDGTADNPSGPCDQALASNSSAPLDYAKAMDLCQSTLETPATLGERRWGVISANLFRADGAGTPSTNSRSIRFGFGSGVVPVAGTRIAVLSTGHAAAQTSPNNANPPYASFQPGQDVTTSSAPPADWLAANGGVFPNAPGCPTPIGEATVNDPVMLKMRIRVPTNARSFSVRTFFYSAEYPEWVCSPFNDFFLTLLDSGFVPAMAELPNPADKNLAVYDPPPAGGSVYPLGVNLAFGNTGLFQQCLNGPTGCGGTSAVAGTMNTCVSTAQLSGTGFDVMNPAGANMAPGFCGISNLLGGGTGWLTTSGNVTPGETIEVRFVIWDTSDPLYDSVVLLDSWLWSETTTEPGTHM